MGSKLVAGQNRLGTHPGVLANGIAPTSVLSQDKNQGWDHMLVIGTSAMRRLDSWVD